MVIEWYDQSRLLFQPPVNEDGSVAPSPSLEFTKVEALMFAFHRICRQAPTFLTEDEERLKDFKLRLQYLARGVTGYIGKLREFLKTAGTKAKPADGQDDVKVKHIALRTNENIQTMIKDLFHSPPIYKASVTLSFKVIYHLLNMGFINIQRLPNVEITAI